VYVYIIVYAYVRFYLIETNKCVTENFAASTEYSEV